MRVALPPPDQLGAQVFDLDPRRATEQEVADVRELVYREKLLVLRGVSLAEGEYVEFASRFGRPQVYFQANYHHPEHPEIFVSSNVPLNGSKVGVAGTGQFWHTDYSFFDEPLPLTFVFPKVVPQGRRETCYTDMARAYRDLPTHLRRYVEDTWTFHDACSYYKVRAQDIDRPIIELIREFHAEAPGAWHPTVIVHPVTGVRILYVSEGFTSAIEGLSFEENRRVLGEIFAFVGRDERIHRHPWNLGDLLLWDNRQLNHRASPVAKGEKSMSFRVGVYDGLPFYTNPREGKRDAVPWNAVQTRR